MKTLVTNLQYKFHMSHLEDKMLVEEGMNDGPRMCVNFPGCGKMAWLMGASMKLMVLSYNRS